MLRLRPPPRRPTLSMTVGGGHATLVRSAGQSPALKHRALPPWGGRCPRKPIQLTAEFAEDAEGEEVGSRGTEIARPYAPREDGSGRRSASRTPPDPRFSREAPRHDCHSERRSPSRRTKSKNPSRRWPRPHEYGLLRTCPFERCFAPAFAKATAGKPLRMREFGGAPSTLERRRSASRRWSIGTRNGGGKRSAVGSGEGRWNPALPFAQPMPRRRRAAWRGR